MTARRQPRRDAARPADPAPPPPATSSGPLGAVMLAFRAAAQECEAGESADPNFDHPDALLARLDAARAAAELFTPRDAQQAAFALGMVADIITDLRSEVLPNANDKTGLWRADRCKVRAEAILLNVLA